MLYPVLDWGVSTRWRIQVTCNFKVIPTMIIIAFVCWKLSFGFIWNIIGMGFTGQFRRWGMEVYTKATRNFKSFFVNTVEYMVEKKTSHYMNIYKYRGLMYVDIISLYCTSKFLQIIITMQRLYFNEEILQWWKIYDSIQWWEISSLFLFSLVHILLGYLIFLPVVKL